MLRSMQDEYQHQQLKEVEEWRPPTSPRRLKVKTTQRPWYCLLAADALALGRTGSTIPVKSMRSSAG